MEAYPTLTPKNPNWTHAGTVSLYERAGFVIVDRPSKKYVVMQRMVAGTFGPREPSLVSGV